MIACASMVSFAASASFLFFARLTRGTVGIDELLSKHIAHLFIRDPIVIFSELLDQDDSKSTDHFEVRSDEPPRSHLADHVLTCSRTEHPVYQLANFKVQAAASRFYHRLARRVSQHGGPNDRL
jgi:hypothetical protein